MCSSVVRVDLSSLAEILNCVIVITPPEISPTQIAVSIRILRVDLDSPAVSHDRAVVIAFAVISPA